MSGLGQTEKSCIASKCLPVFPRYRIERTFKIGTSGNGPNGSKTTSPFDDLVHDAAPAIRGTGGYGTSSVRLVHSGLIFAARITLAHFSVSAAISLPKSAGEPTSTVPPNSASRDLISGSTRPALIALFRLSTISVGVLLGAPKPAQKLASKPGRNSAQRWGVGQNL